MKTCMAVAYIATEMKFPDDEHSHGRLKHCEHYQMTIPSDFSQQERWTGLRTIGMVVREHVDGDGKSKREIRDFISLDRFFPPQPAGIHHRDATPADRITDRLDQIATFRIGPGLRQAFLKRHLDFF